MLQDSPLPDVWLQLLALCAQDPSCAPSALRGLARENAEQQRTISEQQQAVSKQQQQLAAQDARIAGLEGQLQEMQAQLQVLLQRNSVENCLL